MEAGERARVQPLAQEVHTAPAAVLASAPSRCAYTGSACALFTKHYASAAWPTTRNSLLRLAVKLVAFDGVWSPAFVSGHRRGLAAVWTCQLFVAWRGALACRADCDPTRSLLPGSGATVLLRRRMPWVVVWAPVPRGVGEIGAAATALPPHFAPPGLLPLVLGVRAQVLAGQVQLNTCSAYCSPHLLLLVHILPLTALHRRRVTRSCLGERRLQSGRFTCLIALRRRQEVRAWSLVSPQGTLVTKTKNV